MNLTTSIKGSEFSLTMTGSFTFSDNQMFRSLLKELNDAKPNKLIIDVSALEFVDSAALGMFLLLRDSLQQHNCTIELHKPQGQIIKMFELSHFSELFTIVN